MPVDKTAVIKSNQRVVRNTVFVDKFVDMWKKRQVIQVIHRHIEEIIYLFYIRLGKFSCG